MQNRAVVAPGNRARIAECIAWLLGLAATRVALLIALLGFTGGREFTDDLLYHLSMMRDPLQILLGTNAENAHFPILLPFVEALAGLPFVNVFSPFIGMRLAYVATEVVAFAALWHLLGMIWSPVTRRWLAAVWVIAPATWLTTAIMSQEEMISAAFFAVMCILIVRRKLMPAIVVCSLGVVCAKVFFLVPLLALVVGPSVRSRRELVNRVVAASLPILLTYIPATCFWMNAGLGLPIGRLTPPAGMSTSLWAIVSEWTSISAMTMKNASMALALGTGLLPLAILKYRGQSVHGVSLIRTATCMLLWVFATFYCISPEYYALLLPGLLVTMRPRQAILVMLGMFSLMWMMNFFYGLEHAVAASNASGKEAFVRMYQSVMHISPALLHQATLLAFITLNLALAISVTMQVAMEAAPHVRAVRLVPVSPRAVGSPGRAAAAAHASSWKPAGWRKPAIISKSLFPPEPELLRRLRANAGVMGRFDRASDQCDRVPSHPLSAPRIQVEEIDVSLRAANSSRLDSVPDAEFTEST